MTDLGRRLAAEGLGTMLLSATVIGSGIMAERLTGDRAMMLMGNTLPVMAMLVVLIAVLGPVSGAHLNPVVTLVAVLRREIARRDALAYGAVQVAGAIAGAVLAHLMFGVAALQVSQTIRSGAGQWLSEAVASFVLIATIAGAQRFESKALPLLVALAIGSAYWFTASTSFANPALTLARALSDSFAGIRPIDAPGFIAAQFAGALAGAGVMGWLLPRAAGRA